MTHPAAEAAMKRREFLSAAATLLLFTSSASADERLRSVGYLSAGAPITDDSPYSGPVINGLKRLGWIEGSTIHFERRAANGELSRLPSLVNELVAEGVEAILTTGFPAVAACKGASVPAIASGAGDLVTLGLVESFRHPGGNITGISDLAGELAPKRLSILKEVAPSTRKVAMLWNGEDRAMGQRYQLSAASADSLDLTVQPLPVREAHDFDAAFAKMERDRQMLVLWWLIVLPDQIASAAFSSQQRTTFPSCMRGILLFAKEDSFLMAPISPKLATVKPRYSTRFCTGQMPAIFRSNDPRCSRLL
jgi:putative ABC transport system substrate-binding protein